MRRVTRKWARQRQQPLGGMWEQYQQEVLSEVEGPVLLAMLQAAFYAGAISTIEKAGEILDANDGNSIRILFTPLVNEIKAWAEEQEGCDDD